jgi:hypothetical protein
MTGVWTEAHPAGANHAKMLVGDVFCSGLSIA